jgi:hypothetical protein
MELAFQSEPPQPDDTRWMALALTQAQLAQGE